jgi:hypothetical protein
VAGGSELVAAVRQRRDGIEGSGLTDTRETESTWIPQGARRVLGLLLIVELTCGLIIPYVWLVPLTSPLAVFLGTASAMDTAIRLSALLLLIGAVVSVAMSVTLWPFARDRALSLGLWMIVLSAVNLVFQITENAGWLSMLSISQSFALAAPSESGTYQVAGSVFRSVFRWVHYSHILVVVAWLVLLHLVLMRCGAIPRAVGLLVLVASAAHFAGITFPAFAGISSPYAAAFGIPLAVALLVSAACLLTKGASSDASVGRVP